MQKIIEELQRRNVFRVGLAYLALAWLVIQITDVAVPALNLPEVLHGIVFYIGVVGFPFALFFAWAFELTPDGLKRSEDVPEEESIRPATGRSLERIALLLALCALGFVVWDAYLAPDKPAEVITEEEPAKDAAQPQAAAPRSIAVLPFVNMSDDKDYFADGLSEELLNLLAKIPGLQVTGRTSSFAFKGRNVDLREIGSVLGVETILEGSVRRSGDKIRITAQLVNVADGFHLWSDTYDRALTDIFAIQDEIAGHIIDALQIHLGASSQRTHLPTENMEAYELYLKARPMLVGFDTVFEAEKMLLRAVELDPDFAYAWSALSQALNNIAAYDLGPVEEIYPRRREYSRKAFELDPSLLLDGYVANWKEGQNNVALLQDIIARAPNTIYAYDWLGANYLTAGYSRKAVDTYLAALAIDPFIPDVLPQYAIALESLGQREESEATFIRWGDIVGLVHPRLWVAMRYIDAGNDKRVGQLLEEYRQRFNPNVDLGELRHFLEKVLNPATREEAMADPRFAGYMQPPGNPAAFRALLYVLLDDRKLWEMVNSGDASLVGRWLVMQFLLGNHRTITLLQDEEFRAFAADAGMIEVWQQYGPPDFCASGYEIWICEL